jgi:cold shock CspA family protein
VATGKVIRFDEVRGYGFISPDNGTEDVFVHANDLLDGKALFRPGLHVAFEVEDSERGLKASEVRITDPIEIPPAPANPAAIAMRHSVGTPTKLAAGRDELEDGLCDLLSPDELQHELTETLLGIVPSLTGEQILQARQQIITLARAHNWVES